MSNKEKGKIIAHEKPVPAYEADDGELMPEQLAAIRKVISQGRATSAKSSFIDENTSTTQNHKND